MICPYYKSVEMNVKDTNIQKPPVYIAETSHKHDMKIESDKTVCYITGSCVMPDGSIILTDLNNNKLKRLNSSYHVIDHCNLPGEPLAVCCVGQQKVAVAVRSNTICFISIDTIKMSVERSFKVEKPCNGIAYDNNKLYVSNLFDDVVYIYTMSGTCLSTIQKDKNGHDIFSAPKHLAVCPDGSRIYVANYHKGLVVLDDSGRHLSTYEHDAELDGAYGICVDDKGSVLVGCCSNVVQFRDDGTRKQGIIASLEDGEELESICLDKGHNNLIITLSTKNYIKVFRLM